MRILIIAAAAASVGTFWALSGEDAATHELQASAPVAAPAFDQAAPVAFARAWPIVVAPPEAPPMVPAEAAPASAVTGYTAPQETSGDEAELRRVTAAEIARMKAYGIGLVAPGDEAVDDAQPFEDAAAGIPSLGTIIP